MSFAPMVHAARLGAEQFVAAARAADDPKVAADLSLAAKNLASVALTGIQASKTAAADARQAA